MSVPEIQPGESAVAYYIRLRGDLPWDPTNMVKFTNASLIAGLAVADRNEKVQREMLEEIKASRKRLDELARLIPAV